MPARVSSELPDDCSASPKNGATLDGVTGNPFSRGSDADGPGGGHLIPSVGRQRQTTIEDDGTAVADGRPDSYDGSSDDLSANADVPMVDVHVQLHLSTRQQSEMCFEQRAGRGNVDDSRGMTRSDAYRRDSVIGAAAAACGPALY